MYQTVRKWLKNNFLRVKKWAYRILIIIAVIVSNTILNIGSVRYYPDLLNFIMQPLENLKYDIDNYRYTLSTIIQGISTIYALVISSSLIFMQMYRDNTSIKSYELFPKKKLYCFMIFTPVIICVDIFLLMTLPHEIAGYYNILNLMIIFNAIVFIFTGLFIISFINWLNPERLIKDILIKAQKTKNIEELRKLITSLTEIIISSLKAGAINIAMYALQETYPILIDLSNKNGLRYAGNKESESDHPLCILVDSISKIILTIGEEIKNNDYNELIFQIITDSFICYYNSSNSSLLQWKHLGESIRKSVSIVLKEYIERRLYKQVKKFLKSIIEPLLKSSSKNVNLTLSIINDILLLIYEIPKAEFVLILLNQSKLSLNEIEYENKFNDENDGQINFNNIKNIIVPEVIGLIESHLQLFENESKDEIEKIKDLINELKSMIDMDSRRRQQGETSGPEVDVNLGVG
ncbi:hypothetical protein DEAC_c24060 [Desulfosporosinus acididurans]|uniref:DUF2254 domain-containing protein n=1 Tax=Desulfosporosinus acididurans TaxID=476652 RepID=A0A0J1IM48_9FIRM|nr:hypothetical protein [Desulfosporosinus acididurans]KLU65776.1 hypothetical protein DEAC_c24060 [Desulfosporosinus acididurans]